MWGCDQKWAELAPREFYELLDSTEPMAFDCPPSLCSVDRLFVNDLDQAHRIFDRERLADLDWLCVGCCEGL